jgi:hypothetical protein
MAASVPGLTGIHSSARTAAVLVYLGSTTTTLAPASLARATYQAVLVPKIDTAGFIPHRMISRELIRSSLVWPVLRVPYVALVLKTEPS